MALPTKAKTWTTSACNRTATGVLLTNMQELLYRFKVQILAMSGVTVKGSCNQVTGTMDGTDRWTGPTDILRGGSATSAQSWIVLDCANMGGAEFLITYWGAGGGDQNCNIAFSPGGNYALAGTSTHKPTATDEIIIQSTGLGGNGVLDRLWTSMVASDGTGFFFLVAKSGAWESCTGLQLVTTRVLAPSTHSPAVVGFSFGSVVSPATFAGWGTSTAGSRVTPSGGAATNVALFFGAEGYKTSIAGSLQTSVCELQGSAHQIYPVSVWSETALCRGPVGNLVDIWAGNVNASDGDTYPNDATRLFVQVNDLILPWDGTAVVMT